MWTDQANIYSLSRPSTSRSDISSKRSLNTAVLTKVVPQKRKSVRDNADWYYGQKEFGVY